MSGEWRPKVGERVLVEGIVDEDDCSRVPFKVRFDEGRDYEWFRSGEVHPLPPSAPAPREPWETLREAAALIECGCKNRAEVVMERPNSAARWNLCEQPNCMAIEVAAILALIEKEPPHGR
jgi:hypothetical protein